MPLSTVIVVLVTGVGVRWRQAVPHCGQRQLLDTVYVRTVVESAKLPVRASEQNVFRCDFGVSEMQARLLVAQLDLVVGAASAVFAGSDGSRLALYEIHGCSRRSRTDGRFLPTRNISQRKVATSRRAEAHLGSVTRALLMNSVAVLETPSKRSHSKDKSHFDMLRKVCCLSSAPNGVYPDRST
jgi:hypothetical protein